MKYLICFTFLLFLAGCKNNPTDSDPVKAYNVSGVVFNDGKPLANATVSLDKKENFTTLTNSTGEFSIQNVPQGEHSMSVEKVESDGSYVTKTSSLSVSEDVYLKSVLLPKAVKMQTPTEITSKSLHLSWTATNTNDFREYKIYRALTSGLDENTGTLVHVSTAISDTEFTDESLSPITKYFYRVYVMNEFGKLGGSNIVSAATMNKNIIINGSFENLSGGLPEGWLYYEDIANKFSVDQHVAQDGNNSIKIELKTEDGGSNFGWLLYQALNPADLEQGKRYKISFWYKTDTLYEGQSLSFRFTKDDKFWPVILNAPYFCEGPKAPSDWKYYSVSITIPAENTSNYFVEINPFKSYNPYIELGIHPMRAWFDNVKIEKEL